MDLDLMPVCVDPSVASYLMREVALWSPGSAVEGALQLSRWGEELVFRFFCEKVLSVVFVKLI
jgi:hypothetical protein